MECKKKVTIDINRSKKFIPGSKIFINKEYSASYMDVPCGKCLYCRIRIRREWSLRMLHHLHYVDYNALFVTLTYDDIHLDSACSLRKKHLQDFFKRIRKSIYPRKISYFACGEYGSETYRPHYHCIIFGLTMNDAYFIIDNWTYCDWNNAEIRSEGIKPATHENIEYTAGYIHSKLSGPDAKLIYFDSDREPAFRISSQGIGKEYALRHKEQLLKDLHISYKGVKRPIPRYYRKILGIDETHYESIIKQLDAESNEELLDGLNISSDDVVRLGHKIFSIYAEKKRKRRRQRTLNIEKSYNSFGRTKL